MGCLIGTYNRIDTSTLTGGSWASTLPITNLQTKILGQVARTTDAANASSIININIGSGKAIRVVSLVNHNISIAGTYRIRGGSTTSVLDYDSGVLPVWTSVYSTDDLEWEDDAWWSGTYTTEEMSGYTTNVVHILPNIEVLQYWKIEIFDSTNTVGYIQLGRVFIGSAWEPTNDAEVGLLAGWETTTQMQKALNGTRYYQRRNPSRVTKFTLKVIDVDESMAKAFELDRRSGIDGEVLWVHDTEDTLHALRRRFLGNLRELTPVEFPYQHLTTKAYTIEEVL